MAMSENSKKVLKYLQGIEDSKDLTANDVANILGLEPKTVNGIFTSAIQRKELGERVPGNIELEDGTYKTVKFLKLTEAGKSFDPDAVTE